MPVKGNQQNQTFSWGVIGPGQIAREFANDLQYVNQANCTIAAVLGSHEESTQSFAREYNIKEWFTDINEFLNKARMNAVYIASPHPFHYEQTLACLEQNIPVLIMLPYKTLKKIS